MAEKKDGSDMHLGGRPERHQPGEMGGVGSQTDKLTKALLRTSSRKALEGHAGGGTGQRVLLKVGPAPGPPPNASMTCTPVTTGNGPDARKAMGSSAKGKSTSFTLQLVLSAPEFTRDFICPPACCAGMAH